MSESLDIEDNGKMEPKMTEMRGTRRGVPITRWPPTGDIRRRAC